MSFLALTIFERKARLVSTNSRTLAGEAGDFGPALDEGVVRECLGRAFLTCATVGARPNDFNDFRDWRQGRCEVRVWLDWRHADAELCTGLSIVRRGIESGSCRVSMTWVQIGGRVERSIIARHDRELAVTRRQAALCQVDVIIRVRPEDRVAPSEHLLVLQDAAARSVPPRV